MKKMRVNICVECKLRVKVDIDEQIKIRLADIKFTALTKIAGFTLGQHSWLSVLHRTQLDRSGRIIADRSIYHLKCYEQWAESMWKYYNRIELENAENTTRYRLTHLPIGLRMADPGVVRADFFE